MLVCVVFVISAFRFLCQLIVVLKLLIIQLICAVMLLIMYTYMCVCDFVSIYVTNDISINVKLHGVAQLLHVC